MISTALVTLRPLLSGSSVMTTTCRFVSNDVGEDLMPQILMPHSESNECPCPLNSMMSSIEGSRRRRACSPFFIVNLHEFLRIHFATCDGRTAKSSPSSYTE